MASPLQLRAFLGSLWDKAKWAGRASEPARKGLSWAAKGIAKRPAIWATPALGAAGMGLGYMAGTGQGADQSEERKVKHSLARRMGAMGMAAGLGGTAGVMLGGKTLAGKLILGGLGAATGASLAGWGTREDDPRLVRRYEGQPIRPLTYLSEAGQSKLQPSTQMYPVE